MKGKWLVATALVAAVGVLVWYNLRQAGGTSAGAGSATPAGPKNAPVVKVIKAEKRDLTQTVAAPGLLEASGIREVRAPFSSPRVKVLVGIGDRVKEGQVVAELESDAQRLQVTNQEASVARAEAAVAQYLQRKRTEPVTIAQRVESARAAMGQAELGLESALKADSTAQQQVAQARAALLGVQNRANSLNDAVEQTRAKLTSAEAAYRANPTGGQARQAYEDARSAYETALRSSAESARQTAADLAQAQQTLQIAEQKALESGGEKTASVRQARLSLESARQALQAAQLDAEQGGVLTEQIRSAELDLLAAREALEQARQKLAQASVKAPFAGTVLTLTLKNGQPAAENSLLMELGGLESLVVKARVDEVDIGKVKLGQELTIRSNAYLSDRFPGKVSRVAAQSTAQPQGGAGYYEVQGQVENAEGKLKAGMNTEARIRTERRSGVIVVGLESVREEGTRASVLVVRENQVEVRPVKLGLRTQTQVEITEGLAEGDQVIVAPFTLIQKLKDGDPVRVEVTQLPDRGDEQ